MNIQRIEKIPSTHTALKTGAIILPPFTMLIAHEQTAGRGQRGNHWEAEPGLNLTFSFFLKPVPVPPAQQFIISEAFALAFVDTLAEYDIRATIKWPNDIYVGDKKIVGILIDHSLTGTNIDHSLLSAGLNINQTRFLSDAPNPTSMLLERPGNPYDIPNDIPYDIQEVTARLAQNIEQRLHRHIYGKETPHEQFMQHLYRNDGAFHLYQDNIKEEEIRATIADVAPDGLLTLTLPDNSKRQYRFKEVTFLLPQP